MNASIHLHGEHHLLLVVFSIAIAIYSSYTAFYLVSRIDSSKKGLMRNYWLAAAAISMGTGIWAMHFIGMLSFDVNIAIRYHIRLVVASMILPVLTSWLAFYMLSRYALKRHLMISATIMGIGVLIMHYLGMRAMVVPADIRYDPFWVGVSVVIALTATNIAVQLFAVFRDNPVYHNLWAKLAAAFFIGLGISAMHYSAMNAVSFVTEPTFIERTGHDWSVNVWLAFFVISVILGIQLFIFISHYMDQTTSLALKESEQRYRQLVELSPIAIAIHRNGMFTYINPAGVKLLGADTSHQLIGQNVLTFIHPSYHSAVQKRWDRMLRTHAPAAPLEQKLIALNGDVIDVEIRGLPMVLHGQDHIQVFFQDITERKALEEMTHHLAYHDPLTGLPNRRFFEQHFRLALLAEPSAAQPTAILFVDLDGFKQINDVHGHDTGDSLLIKVGEVLTAAVGENGLVARLAGDEFTLLLTDLTREEVLAITQSILKALNVPFIFEKNRITITPSVGISFYLHRQDDVHSLIKKADTAMYQAKERGKNTYQVYEEEEATFFSFH